MSDGHNLSGLQLVEYQTNQLQELISDLHSCCQDKVIMEARRFDLPPAEVKCLLVFSGHRYLTGQEIAGLLEVAKSRATVILDGLERKGFVHRSPDPNDARVKLVGLTPEGLKKVNEMEAFIFDLHLKLLNEIDSSQRPMVIAALENLRHAMNIVKMQLQE
ncbi:MAG: MarR family transcriptional regulator [Desulfobacterales bacterium]|nr:MarR family transcriptional regulator [Desulfobacterales bacterium]